MGAGFSFYAWGWDAGVPGRMDCLQFVGTATTVIKLGGFTLLTDPSRTMSSSQGDAVADCVAQILRTVE